MTITYSSPIMNAPTMKPSDAAERERLHGLLGTALAALIGAPDERRHLNDVLQFITWRCNEAAIVTQVRVVQLQQEIMQQEIAAIQKPHQTNN